MSVTILPIFKGYTVDIRLREFRKAVQGEALEFIQFDSPEGQSSLSELQSFAYEILEVVGVMKMTKSNDVLCLVCYKPMSFLRENEVPEEVDREFACGLMHVNAGMIEHHGWMWCADCKYYTHLPTIMRLLKTYRDKALSQKR